eukprot:NODE_104_length_19294_cov_0.449179.p1 type:complete len:799 gc:universal NODE_104_length_19294_cov_0.449179:6291-8687(+)
MIFVQNDHFVDEHGRTLFLRGVNLGGNSKLPYNSTSKQTQKENITFINRPFPLAEADIHFGRLKAWGFNFIRYCVTWEALEHLGPGNYDDEFIEYLIQILNVGKSYGFYFFIDPHQDVWSRFTGGSGAPYWTLQVVGLNDENFYECGSALSHDDWLSNNKGKIPKMIWPTNYNKLACATMFTLFFGGNKFAPNCMIHFENYSQNIQDFLQESFLNAFGYLMYSIKLYSLESNVIGFDTLNEPSEGFIGCSLDKIPSAVKVFNMNAPTVLQSMKLGLGVPQSVTYYENISLINIPLSNKIDPKGKSVWLDSPIHPVLLKKPISNKNTEFAFLQLGRNYTQSNLEMSWKGCVWMHHGVYSETSCNNDYFTFDKSINQKYSFIDDFWIKFVEIETNFFRSIIPNIICFLEPPVLAQPPKILPKSLYPVVYAPHWYDGITLMTKSFSLVQVNAVKYMRGFNILSCISIGTSGVRACFRDQVEHIRSESRILGNIPFILGETGLAFDLDDSFAMISSDESFINFAYDCYLRSFESNLINYTLWNYNTENDWMGDDNWNDENLSIYSKKLLSPHIDPKICQMLLPDSTSSEVKLLEDLLRKLNYNGRSVKSIVRPFPYSTPGTPISLRFNFKTHYFHYQFMPRASQNSTNLYNFTVPNYLKGVQLNIFNLCEIYLPRYHYSSFYNCYENFDGSEFSELLNQLHINGWDIYVSRGIFWLDSVHQKLYWSIDVSSNIMRAQSKANSAKIYPESCTLEISRHKIMVGESEMSLLYKDLHIIQRMWHYLFDDNYGYSPHEYGKFFLRQ